jgi:alpha-glucuronidase
MKSLLLSCILFCHVLTRADDGYTAWLRYVPIKNQTLLKEYQTNLQTLVAQETHETILKAIEELQLAIPNMLSKPLSTSKEMNRDIKKYLCPRFKNRSK